MKKITNKSLTFYHEGFPTHLKKTQNFSVPILNFALVSKKKNESKLKEKRWV